MHENGFTLRLKPRQCGIHVAASMMAFTTFQNIQIAFEEYTAWRIWQIVFGTHTHCMTSTSCFCILLPGQLSHTASGRDCLCEPFFVKLSEIPFLVVSRMALIGYQGMNMLSSTGRLKIKMERSSLFSLVRALGCVQHNSFNSGARPRCPGAQDMH